jgi:hypothetical protein
MHRYGLKGVVAPVALLAFALAAPRADADFVAPTSNTLSNTNQTVATGVGTSTSTSATNDYLLAVPGSYVVTDTFSSPNPNVLGTSSIGNYSFQDSYVFQVGAAASGDTLIASLDLPNPTGASNIFALDNVQFRLYQITAGSTQPVVGAISAGTAPVVSVLTGWMGISGTDTSSISAYFTGLTSSGTYVLDVAGTTSGTSGGTYVGQLQLAAVPLPAAAWLMLSGLGAIGAFARRRRAG